MYCIMFKLISVLRNYSEPYIAYIFRPTREEVDILYK